MTKIMKKNKSVPNLKAFKQSSSCPQEDTAIGSTFKNIFGLKTKEVRNVTLISDESPQKEVTMSPKSRSNRNLTKLTSESVREPIEGDGKQQSIFKKLSLRLSGSKKDRQKPVVRNNFDVIRVVKTSSNPSINKNEIFRENKEPPSCAETSETTETSETYETSDPNSFEFVRQRKTQMSMRKAFGIFDGLESTADVLDPVAQHEVAHDNDYMKQLQDLFSSDAKRFHANENVASKSHNESFHDTRMKTCIAKEKRQNFRLSSDKFGKDEGTESHVSGQKLFNHTLNDTSNLEHNNATLKPDLYANQLREQARKLSFSKSPGKFYTKQLSNNTSFNNNNNSRLFRLDSRDGLHEIRQDEIHFQQNNPHVETSDRAHNSGHSELSPQQREIGHFACAQEPFHPTDAATIEENFHHFQDDRCIAYDHKSNVPVVDDFKIQDNNKLNCNQSEDVFQIIPETGKNTLKNQDPFDQFSTNYSKRERSEILLNEQLESHQMTDQKPPILGKKPVITKLVSSTKSLKNQPQEVNKSSSASSFNCTTNDQHIFSKSRRRRPSSVTEKEQEHADAGGMDPFLLDSGNGLGKLSTVKNERKLKSTSNISKIKQPTNKSNKNMIRRMSVEKRGKSFEETECEEFALTLAEKLKLVDPQLSNILSTKHKSILDHVPTLTNVCYCPDDTEDFSQIAELRTKSIQENAVFKPKSKEKNCLETIEQEKNEMENMIVKKIEVLYQEKASMERKIVQNNDFGKEVCSSLTDHLESRQVEKFLALAQETEKVMKLILKLSNMLARIEESYLYLPDNSTDREKASLHNKMESLKSRIHEAKLIKESVDTKYEQILSVFHSQLPSSVTKNFDIYLSFKNVFMLDLEELGNEICLAQKQLHSLRSTMTKNSVGTSC